MSPGNGKPDPNDSATPLDVEHELTAAEDDGVEAEQAIPSAEFQKLKGERDLLYDRLARLQAEFDNFRKRNAREQEDFKQYASSEVVKSLLPILDSLQRALDSAPADDKMRQGVELIVRQFNDALAKAGVLIIEAKGKPFDPALHEAIEMVDRTDVPDHQVIDELQCGYRIKDRLLRPAMVRVARNTKKK
jgi:molecular chaperone GrpE